MDDIFQCCYTNSDGWKSVAVSNDIPSDAFKFCMEMQNRNSVMHGKPCDETGNTLNLFQVFGSKGYFYVMRSQYGLFDRVGRPNMFSHAFIISQLQGFADPNSFLSINDSSFKYSEAEAGKFEKPFKSEFMTFDSALNKSGLSFSKLKLLVQAVYIQFSRKLTEPLFVQCDGDEKKIKAMIFLIYTCTPFFIRRKLKIASCTSPADSVQDIIFSINASKHRRYVDPFTEKSSILGNKELLHLRKIAFLDYPLDNIGWTSQNFYSYYYDIEKTAKEFGDVAGSSELTLKISFQYLSAKKTGLASLSDDEIKDCLEDVKLLQSQGCPLVLEWKRMLSEVNRNISESYIFSKPIMEMPKRTVSPFISYGKIETPVPVSELQRWTNPDRGGVKRRPTSYEKEKFWSGMSIPDMDFSPDAIAEYKIYSDGSQKSRMINSYAALAESRTLKVFFNEFLSFYEKYGKNIEIEVLTSSLEKLIEADAKLFHNKTGAYRKLLIILFLRKRVKESDFRKFVDIICLFEDRNYPEFLDEYEKLGKKFGDISNFREFSDVLLKITKALDLLNDSIPLDVWLSISSNARDNSFSFLDEFNPNLCEEEILGSISVVEKNNLRSKKYARDASRYIKEGGFYSSLVKKWMPLFTGRKENKSFFPVLAVTFGGVIIVGIILFLVLQGKSKNQKVEAVNPVKNPVTQKVNNEKDTLEGEQNGLDEKYEIDADDQSKVESGVIEENISKDLENKSTKTDNQSSEVIETLNENKETEIPYSDIDNQYQSDNVWQDETSESSNNGPDTLMSEPKLQYVKNTEG